MGETKGSEEEALQMAKMRSREDVSVRYSARQVRQLVVTISKRMGLLKAAS